MILIQLLKHQLLCRGELMISFIWAEANHGVMGNHGTLPWKLPEDMKYFKDTTMGNPIVSGSRTFRSYNRPLPGRDNYVISTQNDFPEGVIVLSSIDSFLELAKNNGDKEFFVTGGANIFKQLLGSVDRLYRTKIDHDFSGDTYIPEIDYTQFDLLSETQGIMDEKNQYPHKFQIFVRNK